MKQKRFYTATTRLFSALLFLIAFLPNFALSAEIPITHSYQADTQQLTLNWPKYVHVGHIKKDNNLIFTFDYPIRLKQANALSQSVGAIENIRFGYDKLSLTLAPGITPTVTNQSGSVTIEFNTRSPKQENLSTSLLKIRLMVQRGEETEALEQLDTLSNQYPNNRDIAITRADILQQTGRWQAALTTYEQVSRAEPHNEDLQEVLRALVLDHSPYVDFSVEQRDTGDNRSEFFTRAEGEARVTDNINIGLKLERNDVEVDAILDPIDNEIEKIDDEFHRGEAYITIQGPENSTFKLSVFGSEKNIGGGGYYTLRDTKGITLFGIEYNVPNWDFIETVIAAGTRDRIILSRTHRFTPRFNVAVQSGLNQYGLEAFEEAARSASLDGTASYAISSEHHYADFLGHDASLDIRYTLDAEYAFDVETVVGTGGSFNPIPIKTREVHGLVLVVGKRFIKPLLLEVYGGYAIDRLGDDGIKYGADAFFDITDKVALRAGYQHSVSTEISSEDLDSVTAGLRAKF